MDGGLKVKEPELKVSDIAEAAVDAADGEILKAARLMEQEVLADPQKYRALMDPLVASACHQAVAGVVRQTREKIWTAPNYTAGGNGHRVHVLASAQMLMMFPLPGGKRLGEATRDEVLAGAEAIEHGYSPARRSVMWNIGDCIVKAGGPLRELYDQRKAYEIETAKAQGLTVCPAAKIPKKNAEAYRSEGHIHNRAKRYVEKRLLKMLWQEWRRLARGEGAS